MNHLSIDINNTTKFFINHENHPDTRIVRDFTENNVSYWLPKVNKFFIFETNKFSERVEVSKEEFLGFIK